MGGRHGGARTRPRAPGYASDSWVCSGPSLFVDPVMRESGAWLESRGRVLLLTWLLSLLS